MDRHQPAMSKPPTHPIRATGSARVDHDEYATGDTEDEAIVNWAKRYGHKLWNEV